MMDMLTLNPAALPWQNVPEYCLGHYTQGFRPRHAIHTFIFCGGGVNSKGHTKAWKSIIPTQRPTPKFPKGGSPW